MPQTAKMPDVRDRAKKLVELLCESEGNSEILKVRFTYDTAADRIAAEIKSVKHQAWEGRIFTDQAPEHEHVHIDDGVIREALRRVDSEIIKRCALGPPLWPLEQYKKWRSRNARSKPDRRAGKPVRKKQLHRAAARQGGGGEGFSYHLASSGDYKRPLTERWDEYAEAMKALGNEPDFRR